MAEKTRCEICDRNFKDSEGLLMHNQAKHPERVPKKRKKLPLKKIRNWGIFVLVLGGLFWLIILIISNANSYKDLSASEINIKSHQNVVLHYHADLTIIIDSEEYLIPENIGVSSGVMRPLHTHDFSGEIHIEGPVPRDFTLGEFFEVWKKTFDSKCIFEYCTDSGELKMSVNGISNNEFENYILKDGDKIIIEYLKNGNE
jgi:hypothetical protein